MVLDYDVLNALYNSVFLSVITSSRILFTSPSVNTDDDDDDDEGNE